jgi:NADH-quinone oxidoreductase subunit N
MLLVSNSFILLFLSLELYNLTIFPLVVKNKASNHIEAALKYFVFAAFSSALLLFSISVFYFYTGSTCLTNFSLFFNSISLKDLDFFFSFSILLLIISILIKAGSAPFHLWTLDVYAGSPLVVFFFLLVFIKLVFSFLLTKFQIVLDQLYYLQHFLFFFLVLSFLIGFFGSFFQLKLRSLLIYTGIFNLPFFFFHLLFTNKELYVVYLVFVALYSFNLIGLFVILKDLGANIPIYSFFYFNKFNLKIAFLLFLFSLAGLPPLLGFYFKFLFFYVFSLYTSLFFIFIICFSLFAIFFYIRIIRLNIFTNNNSQIIPINLGVVFSIIISFVFWVNLFSFFFFDFFCNFISVLV